MADQSMTNEDVAQHLRNIADALEQTGANPHRIAAYFRGAGGRPAYRGRQMRCSWR